MRQRLTKLATILGVGSLFLAALAWAQGAASQPVTSATWWTWLQANYGKILTLIGALLPTLITGLSEFPRAAGVVAWLKKLLALFSLVQHADSAGTFKALLKPCNAPVEKPATPTVKPGMPLAVALLLVIPLAFGSTSCCLLKGNCSTNPTVNQMVDCAKTGLTQATIDLVNDIIKLVTNQAVDWSAELTKLEQQGVATVTCAVALAEQLLAGLVNPTSGPIKPQAIKAQALAGLTPAQATLGSLRLSFYLANTHRTATNVPRVSPAP